VRPEADAEMATRGKVVLAARRRHPSTMERSGSPEAEDKPCTAMFLIVFHLSFPPPVKAGEHTRSGPVLKGDVSYNLIFLHNPLRLVEGGFRCRTIGDARHSGGWSCGAVYESL
jgi:hypothetical protein